MVAKRNFAALSIPFTAGVAVAAAIPSGEETCLLIALTLSCAIPFLVYVLYHGKGDSPISGMLLFFLAGAFLFFSAGAIGPYHSIIPHWADTLKDRFCHAVCNAGFGKETTTSLLLSLLFGERKTLPAHVSNAFRMSGASHILALSGLHLGILYAMLSGLFSILGNSAAALVARCVLIISSSAFYTVITGAPPSLVRAFLFISLSETASLARNRKKKNLNIFCAALMIQLTLNPRVIESLGFQLSYLAMLGIYTLFPYLRNWYPEGKGRFLPVGYIWTSVAMSLSCQIFTAPLVYLKFGTFPKYFLVTNLVSLPLTEALVICGLASTVLETLHLCPQVLKSLSDILAQALIFCLETISTL